MGRKQPFILSYAATVPFDFSIQICIAENEKDPATTVEQRPLQKRAVPKSQMSRNKILIYVKKQCFITQGAENITGKGLSCIYWSNSHSFGGKYLELKPNEFLKYTDTFDDPNLPGEMITTVWLRKSVAGTELKITQEGIPEVIPADMCYLGWQDSHDKLAKLVEPEIPDA